MIFYLVHRGSCFLVVSVSSIWISALQTSSVSLLFVLDRFLTTLCFQHRPILLFNNTAMLCRAICRRPLLHPTVAGWVELTSFSIKPLLSDYGRFSAFLCFFTSCSISLLILTSFSSCSRSSCSSNISSVFL